jgi:RNA polymerase sigma factor (sigma-70 family)
MTLSPWASGPAEVLQHGFELLERDTDAARRLAMITIDNAVELTIGTFLGLPKRITGIRISRKEREGLKGRFPDMLDALEEHASESLGGVDLGYVEWYHRLRNQLYHEGNGLTIEREKVHAYAEIARSLWTSLLGGPEGAIPTAPSDDGDLLRRFVDATNALASVLDPTPRLLEALGFAARGSLTSELIAPQALGRLDPDLADKVAEVANLRDRVLHGEPGAAAALTPGLVEEVQRLAEQVRSATKHAVEQALEGLSELDREVLTLRFGLTGDPPKTLEGVGSALGLTREHVRQIENRALRHLASLRAMDADL